MDSIITLQVKKSSSICFQLMFLLFVSHCSFSQMIYSNGNLTTGTVTKSGVTAPAGYSWSELQNNTGNTTECNRSSGFAGYFNTAGSTSFQLGDDFVVPAGQQ